MKPEELPRLKVYCAQVAERRQSLMEQQTALQRQREALGMVEARTAELTAYRRRVCARLQTFDIAEKRLALEALDIQVKWTREETLVIQGSVNETDFAGHQALLKKGLSDED